MNPITCHADIPLITTWLQTKYLYNLDVTYGGLWEKCNIFAVSSYKDNALTTKIRLLSNGAVFDYIPLTAFNFFNTENSNIDLNLKDLCYHNCITNNIAVSIHTELRNYPCWCFFKRIQKWIKGDYVCTVDWYDANQNVNIVTLENGQIASVPNHKCLFTNDKPTELPEYKLLIAKWDCNGVK